MLSNVILNADSITWLDGPRGMPPGYQQSIMHGDPRADELFIFRAKIPSHWTASPHFHPIDEHMTVLEGSCYLGIGEKYDESAATELRANAFTVMKAGVVHYFFTKSPCVIQVHGMGPHKITYVNPTNDPRNNT
jgi:mannose-6-phosphate isomerase-like protein (cupin superfamily)